jgi:hypothetical protein
MREPSANLGVYELSLCAIGWDTTSLTLVREGAVYGRMARTGAGSVVCVHEWRGAIWCSRFEAGGWMLGGEVASYGFGPAANPNVAVAPDGCLLCAYNERPCDGTHPFAIAIARSEDDGRTWSTSRHVYVAGIEWENGCWEPALLVTPSGETQLFFANEHPYPDSREQEISLCRSFDSGATWSPAAAVSFRAGHRDGMPSPVRLIDGSGTVMAIEDNGVDGAFKPVMVFSPAEEEWVGDAVPGDSDRRWPALTPPLAASVYAGAPHLCQLSTGATILSVQSDEGSPGARRMTVYVGGPDARGFAHPSRPFPGIARWNSLHVHPDDTVTAVATAAVAGVEGVWTMDGRLGPTG